MCFCILLLVFACSGRWKEIHPTMTFCGWRPLHVCSYDVNVTPDKRKVFMQDEAGLLNALQEVSLDFCTVFFMYIPKDFSPPFPVTHSMTMERFRDVTQSMRSERDKGIPQLAKFIKAFTSRNTRTAKWMTWEDEQWMAKVGYLNTIRKFKLIFLRNRRHTESIIGWSFPGSERNSLHEIDLPLLFVYRLWMPSGSPQGHAMKCMALRLSPNLRRCVSAKRYIVIYIFLTIIKNIPRSQEQSPLEITNFWPVLLKVPWRASKIWVLLHSRNPRKYSTHLR